jgi:hypothetical protein
VRAPKGRGHSPREAPVQPASARGSRPDYSHDPIGFIDAYIPLNEKGQPWRLAPYQRDVLRLILRPC